MNKYNLQIPVRSLVEYALRSGDLELDSFLSSVRAVDGIRAHQKIQNSRPDEYIMEVPISLELERGNFIVTVSGRMDGIYVYTDPDRAIVDEIKSTTRDPDFFEKDEKPVHWGQAKVYAYMYAYHQHLQEMSVQLTYYQLESEGKKGKIREFLRTFTFSELETFFNDLLDRYLKWAETLEQWRAIRDESIEQLQFPYGGFRPGQRQMALSIYRAIENGEQLIVEAPTGIGKTMGSIFPAVKTLGKEMIQKFFYLTAKTTGRTVAQKALDQLRDKGLRLKSLVLTAKDKICFNPDCACSGEECEYARGYYDRINDAVSAVFEQDALSRDAIETGARNFKVCPYEFSLELSLWVDAIICDYNYAFNPRVYLKRFFGPEALQEKYAFLVDEANNLVDRSRDMFSAELFKEKFLEFRRAAKKEVSGIRRSIGSINRQMTNAQKQCDDEGKPVATNELALEFEEALYAFVAASEKWLVKNIKTPYRRQLMELYFDVVWFLKILENYYNAYSICYEEINGDFRIKLFCMDPSKLLKEVFQRCSSVVFFSATLSPVDYFKYILGCDPTVKELILPSPFPPENLCLLTADRVSTLYKYRDRTKVSVARLIDGLVTHQPGNYLVFFPSYQYLNMIYQLFLSINNTAECVVQTSGMTEMEREMFLEQFSVDNKVNGKTLVGFAVMGGIFGEGIDLVGDRLTGAVIVGVGLPGISLERELIKEYFTQLQGTGFEYAYLYPGMNRVFQAAGRVIRSAQDRGVVLLIDHRFSTPQYKDLFPMHWNPVRIRDEQHLAQILINFNLNYHLQKKE
ncbi:MAG: helicase C-terminal domain-containing protein [Candidatus Omnitrophota bacterium]